MAQWTCSQQTRFDYHCHPWFISGLRKSIWQSWSDSWCHSDCFQPWETSFICRHCWVFEHNIKRRLLMKFLMVLQMMQKLRKKNLLESLMRLQSTNSHLKTLSWGNISCSLHQHIHLESKKGDVVLVLLPIISPNIDWFSKFFQWQT